MTAISNLSDFLDLVTGAGAPQHLPWWKDASVGGVAAAAPIAGRITSLWQYDGCPSHGAVPGAVSAPNNTTAGGLQQTDPTAGKQLWLTNFGASPLTPGTPVVYDRLLHVSGFSGTNVGAQAVGGALTRYTSGPGNIILVEIFVQIGATPTTITASYTNQDGNPATTQAVTIGGTNFREAQRMIILPLASGDTGARGVTSVTLAGSTGTVGDFGVVIAHQLTRAQAVVIGSGGLGSLLLKGSGPIEVMTDACIAMYWEANTTTIPQIDAEFHFVEK